MIQTVGEYLKTRATPPTGYEDKILASIGAHPSQLLMPATECLCDCFKRADQYYPVVANKYGLLDKGRTDEIVKLIAEYGKNAAEDVLRVYMAYKRPYEFVFRQNNNDINLYQLTANYLMLQRQTAFAETMSVQSTKAQALSNEELTLADACEKRIIKTVRRQQKDMGMPTLSKAPTPFELSAILRGVYMRTRCDVNLSTTDIEMAVNGYLLENRK